MIRYTLRQLEYFTACVETGSLAAAAARLNVSQPSISAALAKLEAQLGVQLLLRHHAQGVSPTASGERLLQVARNLLTHASDLQRLAESAGEAVSGEVRIGGFLTLGPAYLPGLVAAVRERYPQLQLRLGEATQDRLIEELRRGRHELALLYDIDLPDDLRRTPLTELTPHVLLSAAHPLARRKRIALTELAEEPMILLDVPPSRGYFTGLLTAAGVEPRIAFSSPSLELVRGLVGRGLGYSLLVTRPHGDVSQDGQPLAARPIAGAVATSQVVLASLRALRPTRAMTAFEETAAAYFAARPAGGEPPR